MFFLQTQLVSIDLYFFSSNPGCGSWQSVEFKSKQNTLSANTSYILQAIYIYCCQRCFWLLYVYICLYLSYTCWTPLTVSGDVVTLVEQTSHDWISMFNFSQPQPQSAILQAEGPKFSAEGSENRLLNKLPILINFKSVSIQNWGIDTQPQPVREMGIKSCILYSHHGSQPCVNPHK